jgi:hypothetical protein
VQLFTHDALPALLADLASDESQDTVLHVQRSPSRSPVTPPLP